jgi:CRP/FNR family cyclic AMP-dependent transcriptional regulator
MASTDVLEAHQTQLAHPLSYLAGGSMVEYRKGEVIYGWEHPSSSMYLVVEGRVKIGQLRDDGRETIIDIRQRDDSFGELAFLNLSNCPEQATALENARVMTWSTSTVEHTLQRRPRLAIALLQVLAQHITDLNDRIQNFRIDNSARRLAWSLIRFSDRKIPQEDGRVHIVAFTHELLAQYLGTSREIVTRHLTQFRRDGYVQYSRKGLLLDREALYTWLGQSVDCG